MYVRSTCIERRDSLRITIGVRVRVRALVVTRVATGTVLKACGHGYSFVLFQIGLG